MKTFKNCAAQGDVYFIRTTIIPEGYVEVLPENGDVIVTHSETGHHHVMHSTSAKMYRSPYDEFDSVLVVEHPTELRHKRTFDTHESILFDTGIYKVRRQREYTPAGFRKVQD